METKLFSPLLSSANNILGNKRTLTKKAKDYQSFINFLDTSNKDLKKIKLPTKRKIKNLTLGTEFGMGGGSSFNLINIVKNLAIGGGEGLAGGLGLRALVKKLFGGKNAGKITQTAEESLVKPANKIVEFNRNTLGKGATETIERQGGKTAAENAAKILGKDATTTAAKEGGGAFGRRIPILGPLVGFGIDISTGEDPIRAGAGAIGALFTGLALGTLGIETGPGAIAIDIAGQMAGESAGKSFYDKLMGKDKGNENKSKPDSKDKTDDDKIKARLKEQERKQREAASKKITFADITNKFDKVVSKFEKFAGGMGSAIAGKQPSKADKEDTKNYDPPNADPINTGNAGEPTGLQLENVESTGGEVPGRPDSPFGQGRGDHIHKGNDYFKNAGTPISLIQGGTVTVADMNYDPNGWGALVEIRHRDGSLSRYAHLSRISVAPGSTISPGQVIGYTGGTPGAPGSGNAEGPHLHFEYLPPGSSVQVDPTEAAKLIFRFGGNVRVRSSGQQSGAPGQTPSGTPSPNQSRAKECESYKKNGDMEGYMKCLMGGIGPETQPANDSQNTKNVKKYFNGITNFTRVYDPKTGRIAGSFERFKGLINMFMNDWKVKENIYDEKGRVLDPKNPNDFKKIQSLYILTNQITKEQPRSQQGGRTSPPPASAPSSYTRPAPPPPNVQPPPPPPNVQPPPPLASSPQSSTPNVVVVNNQQAPQQQGQQVVPFPVPVGGGGGGGGGASSMNNSSFASEVVNSFAKLILLTNLSGS